MPADDHRFDEITLDALRARRSIKWRQYRSDVLPAWVAEMDYPLAEPIARALETALAIGDAGYPDPKGLGEAFATWAKKTWDWIVDPDDVFLVADVMTGVKEILRVATAVGDGVVIEPPIYHPFPHVVRSTDRVVVEVPLVREGDRHQPDLDGIEKAYANGAKAHLLCSPHNPTGIVLTESEVTRIAELADHYGVLVLSDEIHAPLVLGSARHHPLVARTSIVLTSASKAWNIPGLKAAVMVAGSKETRTWLEKLPWDMPFHAGHFGVLAGAVAFTEGDAWLAETRTILERNRELLRLLLAEHLPEVRYTPMQASYLAWLDCRALGLGDDPAKTFLEKGRVALSPGPIFGTNGAGFARLNIATTKTLLEEAVLRMKRSIR